MLRCENASARLPRRPGRAAFPALLTARVLAPVLAAVLGAAAPAAARQPGEAAGPAAAWQVEWPRTDFARHTVPLEQIRSGGPPRDGIPPVDHPRFIAVAEASWLDPSEPVVVFGEGADVRAYPLQILMWHEIVNDTVGGRPVVVTFCPLCNSALVFSRTVKGRTLDFGTTGKLRHSDLVMWDRQTESWWQQMTGTAVVGALTGSRLEPLPAPLVTFGTFRDARPQGRVLSRETGFLRRYGDNPYVAYDHPDNTQPFLFRGRPDGRLPATARVVALEVNGEARAYAYRTLAPLGAVNDTVGGRPVVVWHRPGARSALDGYTIAQSRVVGTGVVFDRRVDGRTLTFRVEGDALVDNETGTRWSPFGEGRAGPLQGHRLTPVVHGNPFAFAWFAFRPDSGLYAAPGTSP